MVHKLTDTIKFQSTLPGRGATGQIRRDHRRDGISIHAPREGSDDGGDGFTPEQLISIHAPREGSDPRE